MTKINTIKERLLRMCNQSSNIDVRENLIELLSNMVDVAPDTQAAIVAETLLGKLYKYSHCYCSDRQAYVIAQGIYEYCLDVNYS